MHAEIPRETTRARGGVGAPTNVCTGMKSVSGSKVATWNRFSSR